MLCSSIKVDASFMASVHHGWSDMRVKASTILATVPGTPSSAPKRVCSDCVKLSNPMAASRIAAFRPSPGGNRLPMCQDKLSSAPMPLCRAMAAVADRSGMDDSAAPPSLNRWIARRVEKNVAIFSFSIGRGLRMAMS